MDRTLYLSENRKVTVYRDGPSVWIAEKGKSGRRIPARLVSRVVIIGNVKLDAGVITLFTDNRVPVTLINQKGGSAAVVMPYIDRLPYYYERQRACLSSDERIRRFKDWIFSRRREQQLYAVFRLSKKVGSTFASKGFREKDYHHLLERFRPFEDSQWVVVLGAVRSLVRELIIACLVKSDLDPHLGAIYRRHNFGLALDICHVLEPEMELQSILFLRGAAAKGHIIKDKSGWSMTGEGIRDIAQRFENRRKQLQSLTERLLDDLFELMRELRK